MAADHRVDRRVTAAALRPEDTARANHRLHALAHDLNFRCDGSVVRLRDLARGGAHPGCAAESLRQAFVKLSL